jgi:Lhr-like helicase
MTESPANPPAFSRLHPSVQEALYRMRWTQLRPIQVETIHEVFDGRGDLVISARTAAGKTEAAFLPIVSRIVAGPRAGVRAIYAGPLKALINDQFRRLEELCAIAEIPVHKVAVRDPAHHARVNRVAVRQPPRVPGDGVRAARVRGDRRDALVPGHRAGGPPQEPHRAARGEE